MSENMTIRFDMNLQSSCNSNAAVIKAKVGQIKYQDRKMNVNSSVQLLNHITILTIYYHERYGIHKKMKKSLLDRNLVPNTTF